MTHTIASVEASSSLRAVLGSMPTTVHGVCFRIAACKKMKNEANSHKEVTITAIAILASNEMMIVSVPTMISDYAMVEAT